MVGLNHRHKGLDLRIYRVKATPLPRAFVLCLFAGLATPVSLSARTQIVMD